MEEEATDPIGPIPPEVVKSILARRYWNYEKVGQWIETLPQVQGIFFEQRRSICFNSSVNNELICK